MTTQRWHTSRTWPGGPWGEALAQCRKAQHLTQSDVADYVGASLSTVRKWEDGAALPDRSHWPRLEEAMGLPVPDPRVPECTPAERELIDTMLLLVDELRALKDHLADILTPAAPSESPVPEVMGVAHAAEYLATSESFVRRLVAERRLVHYKVGGHVRFRKADLDRFIEEGKREPYQHTPWQLRNGRARSPRARKST